MFVKVVDILHYSCNMIRYYDDFCINIKSTCNNYSKFETYTGNRKQMQMLRAKLMETCTYYYIRSYCWRWHQCWCLSYIQVKTSYQEFSKNYQEQNQLFFIEHHWLHTHWGTPEPVLDLFCCPTDLWSTIDCLYR